MIQNATQIEKNNNQMTKLKITVLTGAGISAESGISTFRDNNGLWEQHRIEDVATPEAWKKNPEMVLRFYNERRKKAMDAQPNNAHKILADLEKDYHLQVITQNVDDLHERAGSKNVLHLHGSLFSKCSDKDRTITAPTFTDILLNEQAPDGGNWRPDIVWFGEDVPMFGEAEAITAHTDVLLVVGTSLVVYPAANLVHHVPLGTPIFIIDPNFDTTSPNKHTTIIKEPATVGMEKFKTLLKTL